MRRPELPDLERPDPVMGRRLGYRLLEDGSLRLEVEGATAILGRIVRPSRFVVRVTLPKPSPGSAGRRTP